MIMSSLQPEPALLGLDWGTSSLRAYLLASDATILDQRHSDQGVQYLPQAGPSGFVQAFEALAGDWQQSFPHLPLLACGMVGSSQGWREVPYSSCPADPEALGQGCLSLEARPGLKLRIIPGVIYNKEGECPDVMRGEETQVLGALELDPSLGKGLKVLVLPGTHSKWVWLEEGKIIKFATYMTGELFAVLRRHSILGKLIGASDMEVAPGEALAAFDLGLQQCRDSRVPGQLAKDLFSVRSLGLTGQLAPELAADYLSGLLIGHELSGALAELALAGLPAPACLLGEDRLCQRYARALSLFDRPLCPILENTAPQGMVHLARTLGLINEARPCAASRS